MVKEGKEPFCLGKGKAWMPSKQACTAFSSPPGPTAANSFLHHPRAKIRAATLSYAKASHGYNNPDCAHRRFPNFPLAVIGSRVVLPAPLQKTPLSWPGWSFHPPAAGQQKT